MPDGRKQNTLTTKPFWLSTVRQITERGYRNLSDLAIMLGAHACTLFGLTMVRGQTPSGTWTDRYLAGLFHEKIVKACRQDVKVKMRTAIGH